MGFDWFEAGFGRISGIQNTPPGSTLPLIVLLYDATAFADTHFLTVDLGTALVAPLMERGQPRLKSFNHHGHPF